MDDDDQEIEREILFDVICGTICAIGIIGNVLVLFVNLVLKEYTKTATNWYILQLATADLLCLVTIPFAIAEDLLGRWSFPTWTCKLKETIFFVNYFASVMILTVMSMDRYCAVCRNFSAKIQHLRSKKTAVLSAVIVWALAILMSFPVMLASDVNGFDPYCKCRHDFTLLNKREKCIEQGLTEEECDEALAQDSCMVILPMTASNESDYADDYYYNLDYYNDTDEALAADDEDYYSMGCSYKETSFEWKAYIYWCFITMFVIPFMLMAFSYSCIVMKLRRSALQTENVYRRNSSTKSRNSNNRKKTAAATPTGAQRNRARVTRVCFLLVMMFLICWCPFYAVHLAKMVGINKKTTEYCNILTLISTALAYSNSAINPYIYNFMGTSFIGRISKAASSVKSSLKLSSSSFSSDTGFRGRYAANRRSSVNARLNKATGTAKSYRGKRQVQEIIPTKRTEEIPKQPL